MIFEKIIAAMPAKALLLFALPLIDVVMNADMNLLDIASRLSPSGILVLVAYELKKQLAAMQAAAAKEEAELRKDVKEQQVEFLRELKANRDHFDKVVIDLDKKHEAREARLYEQLAIKVATIVTSPRHD